ncbi:T9SS type A sorting domain-containing protein, partial [Crocinitomix catalasitica]|nr:T9SS type A sorting domain-containing protein [Crocinitomix catalasitica]
DVKIYFDGLLQPGFYTLGSHCGPMTSSTEPLLIGTYFALSGSYTTFYDGMLDELRIWDKILTPTEIFDNYSSALIGDETDLVLYLNFTELISGPGETITNDAVATGSALDALSFSLATDSPFTDTDTCFVECVSSSSSITVDTCNYYTVPSGDSTYSVSGFYMDTLINTGGCDSIITIDLTITLVDTSVTLLGGLLTADFAGATYQWIDCSTGLPIAGEINQFFDPLIMGYYAVIVTNGACTDTSDCYLSACDTSYNTVNPIINICAGDSVDVFGTFVSSAGIYSEELLTSSGCDSTVNQEVTVTTVDVSVTVVGDVLTVDFAGATYQWINCSTGLPIPGEINQFFSPGDSDEYACIVTYGGCSDTTDCIRIEGIGFDELMSSEIDVYPNPTSGNLQIRIAGIDDAIELTVVDIKGRIVRSVHSVPSTYTLNLSNLEKGIYFISFQSEKGVVMKKICLIK